MKGMSMRITDDSDETFEEDMVYLRLLLDRIFRTAINNDLDLSHLAVDAGLPVLAESVAAMNGGEKEFDSMVEALDDTETPLSEVEVKPRDKRGRFVKTHPEGD